MAPASFESVSAVLSAICSSADDPSAGPSPLASLRFMFRREGQFFIAKVTPRHQVEVPELKATQPFFHWAHLSFRCWSFSLRTLSPGSTELSVKSLRICLASKAKGEVDRLR